MQHFAPECSLHGFVLKQGPAHGRSYPHRSRDPVTLVLPYQSLSVLNPALSEVATNRRNVFVGQFSEFFHQSNGLQEQPLNSQWLSIADHQTPCLPDTRQECDYLEIPEVFHTPLGEVCEHQFH